jgi:hypothetical protein
MSKKFSLKEKREWLDMFESGETESQIAKATGHDLRTIVNGLQEASRARHLANAESEMLRTALLSHQDMLKSLLKNIVNMLILPAANLELREDENGFLAPTPLPGLLIEQNPNRQIALRIHDEEKLEWELLEEHLKSDKLWALLKKWRQVLTEHISARYRYKKAIKSLLVKETSLKFRTGVGNETEYLVPETVDLFYGVAMNHLLGVKDATDLENNIEADDNGFIKHGSTVLARCKKAISCRDKIIVAFISLPKTTAAADVKSTFTELTAVIRAARRQAEEILLLGMITGKCRVCTRLGK